MRLRARLVSGGVGRVSFISADLSPLISRCRDSSPKEGKPSLHCANTANVAYMTDMSNISLNCGLPLRFALVALSCSAKGILQKGFPLGGRWRRRRRMRAESSFHYPPNKREAALFQRFAPPDTPKTSLCGNRRPKNAENPHNPKRRLPCREVRGGSGRFGG